MVIYNLLIKNDKPVYTVTKNKPSSITSGQVSQISQASTLNIIYGKQKIKVSPETIASWYQRNNDKYTLSGQFIKEYLERIGNGMGIEVSNTAQSVYQIRQALTLRVPADIVLNAKDITKTFTYCAQLKGVSPAYLPNFSQTLEQIYSDPRGGR